MWSRFCFIVFEIRHNNTEPFLNQLNSNSNVTHALILRPLKPGYYNFTAAEVSYVVSEESNERTVSVASHYLCYIIACYIILFKHDSDVMPVICEN